ncbi:YqcI/YcgG family protein [Halalkalibacterium halodurans]|uniref:YqcI/YcgG family protein n=1 Tax=Halalkalibacterium halodurans TaxID=86665 RepID=UPI003B9725F8
MIVLLKVGCLLDQEKLADCIGNGELEEWMVRTYYDFRRSLLDVTEPYPCYFAVEAEKNGLIRYIFAESAYDEKELHRVKNAVYEYIKSYRSIGKRTTLVLFFKPIEGGVSEDYKKQFWNVINFLNVNDPSVWPPDIPNDPNDPKWEFCFAGEPIFLVCREPFYNDRKSRYTPYGLEITMQPRGTLDDITGDTAKGRKVREVIRERLKKYDKIASHPDIGDYGDPDSREWKQYVLPETNEESVMRCPITGRKNNQ